MIDFDIRAIVDDLPFAKRLLMRMESYDHTTYMHLWGVAFFAYHIAEALGLKDSEKQLIAQAGLLHDVGKLLIPIEILNAPRRLTRPEWSIMRTHTLGGKSIVLEAASRRSRRHLPRYEELARVILHHHERWDGRGYPDQLAGHMIPLGSRIVSIVDAYDALISGRPYLDPLTSPNALNLIRSDAGKAFDAMIVRWFLRTVGDIDLTPHPTVTHPSCIW